MDADAEPAPAQSPPLHEGGATCRLRDEPRTQSPDYVGACEFLGSISSVPALIAGMVLTGWFIGGIVFMLASDLGWSLAARSMERRRGEPGRSVATFVQTNATRWRTLAVIGAALALTKSFWAALSICILLQVALHVALSAKRRLEDALRRQCDRVRG